MPLPLAIGASLPRMSDRVKTMCWTDAPGETFQVRAPGYKVLNVKQASGPSLYETFAVDAYSSPKKVPHFAQYVDMPKPDEDFGIPQYFVINMMLPRYAPNLVWAAAGDGESWCVILYCRLTEAAKDLIRRREPSPALRLWQRFVATDRRDPMKERLKCIVRALNPAEVGFNTATRSLINKYNAKPFMIRTTSSFYQTPSYFEIDIDIHNFGKTARIGLYGCSEVATQVVFEMSAVIQGETDDELPEQILCGVRLDKLDPTLVAAVPFDPADIKIEGRSSPNSGAPSNDETVHPDE